jgi:hypothetical protein
MKILRKDCLEVPVELETKKGLWKQSLFLENKKISPKFLVKFPVHAILYRTYWSGKIT